MPAPYVLAALLAAGLLVVALSHIVTHLGVALLALAILYAIWLLTRRGKAHDSHPRHRTRR